MSFSDHRHELLVEIARFALRANVGERYRCVADNAGSTSAYNCPLLRNSKEFILQESILAANQFKIDGSNLEKVGAGTTLRCMKQMQA